MNIRAKQSLNGKTNVGSVLKGEDGATFIPEIDSDGNLSWSNNKGLDNPETINLRGPQGDPGKSAYEIALDNGFEGSETEWLASLKGATGSAGTTPKLSIGTVETLDAGSDATASIGGTAANPVLNLGIPKGADGSDSSQNKPSIPNAIELAAEMGLVSPVIAEDGSIYTDENGAIYTL